MDAEKCFDRVWHDGLFHKLLPRITFTHWLTLYEWYSKLKAVIRWNGTESAPFTVSRGIRQGSLLSPIFFTMFIDDLLTELSNTNCGLRIDKFLFNNFAYADDVNLLAASVPGLQRLIDVCYNYSKKWRFVFGFAKTRCTVFGDAKFYSPPTWTLGQDAVNNTDNLDILGVNLRADLKSSTHVSNRISAARRKAYSLLNSGLTYPGLSTEVKVYLWKTAVCPILTFGCHLLSLGKRDIAAMEAFQSNNIKRIFGFPKRSHHSKLLVALGIRSIASVLNNLKISLFNRVFKRDSPVRDLNVAFISRHICKGHPMEGTLSGSISTMGLSPSSVAFAETVRPFRALTQSRGQDGVVDSLRELLHSGDFVLKSSKTYHLARLLVKAF